MANYFPLIANVTGNTALFTELPVGGNLNLANAGIINLATSNLNLTGGSNGQYLKTDGVGNLTWGTISPSGTSNGNSGVNVAANGNITMSVAGNANIVTITGTGANITGTGNITGNLAVGGDLTVTGNTSLGKDLVVTGNLTVNGTQTTVNSTTVSTNDKNIVIANNAANASVADGAGITINGANATITYGAASNTFSFSHRITGNLNGSANTVSVGAQPNITSVGNLSTLRVLGVTNLGAVGNVSITGGSNGQMLKTDGNGLLSWGDVVGGVSSVELTGTGVTFDKTGQQTGNVKIAITNSGVRSLTAGNNISLSSSTGLVTASVDTFTFAKEKVTINTAGATGAINLDVLSNAITFYSGNATGNVTLNIRGNSTVTLNTMLAVGESVTSTFVYNTGASGFTTTAYQIDGVAVTPRWSGNTVPYVAITGTQSVTLTAIKTAASTYTVIGSFTGYR
jgi:hypothetical protein